MRQEKESREQGEKKEQKIRYLTFETSARCNMDCEFCFSEWRTRPGEMSTEEAQKAILFLKGRGLEAINYTGGESLLRNDIAKLIGFSKKLGLTTILSTNGILLEKKLHSIAGSLDYVGLPLDSSEASIHNEMRRTNAVRDHHLLINEWIYKLNREYSHIGIKVNTVVTKFNQDYIIGIGNLIRRRGNVVSWKLSEFTPEGYGSLHNEKYCISREAYERVYAECKKSHPGINIIHSSAHERDDCCRVLSSQGHLLKPLSRGFHDLGRLILLSEKEMADEFDEKRNIYFFKQTYGARDLE